MKKFSYFFVSALFFFFFLTNISFASDYSSFITEIDELPDGDFQFHKIFPSDSSSSPVSNSSGRFQSYKGQGELYVNIVNVDSFKLYINDTLISSDDFSTNGKYKVDIANCTKNGSNSLLLLNYSPSIDSLDSSITIEIPYPVVKDEVYGKNILNHNMLLLLDQIVSSETKYGLTGAQISVIKDGVIQKTSSFGYLNDYKNVVNNQNEIIQDKISILPISERIKVSDNTLFDMASNTKMYATVYALQKLVSEGKISFEDKIVDFFPTFIDNGIGIQSKEKVTVGNLLRHDAGFTPDPQYHNENYLDLDYDNTGKNPYFSQNRDLTLEMVLKTPLQSKPGSKVLYSDVDFMLLGFVVEKVTGMRLDDYVNQNFYSKLNLSNTTFNPLDNGISTNQISASELHGNSRDGRVSFINNRNSIIQGTVHDEKAYYSMGGVSGHAGLFSTSTEIAKLAQLMLSNGGNGINSFFDSSTIDRFVSPSNLNDTYAYGWRKQGNQNYTSIFSSFASNQTFGHTGWTGTLSLIEPKENLVLVMNSNARNSLIMGPGQNTFYTSSFLTNNYGTISSLVFQSLDSGDSVKVDNLLIELIEQKAKMVFEGSQKNTSGRNSLRALLSILDTRSLYSEDCSKYKSTKKIKNMILDLKNEEKTDFEQLEFSNAIEYSILNNYLTFINKLNKEFYTETSWSVLEENISKANTILQDVNCTQSSIDIITKELVDSIDLLEENNEQISEVSDKTKLEEDINLAKTLDRNLYSSSSLDNLDKMLSTAEEVFSDSDSKQIDIDKAETNLKYTIEILEIKPLELNLSTRSLEVIKLGSRLKVTSENYSMNELSCTFSKKGIVSINDNGEILANKVGITKVSFQSKTGMEESFTLRVTN